MIYHWSFFEMTDHVLHLEGAENYYANNGQPLVGFVTQKALTVTQCYPCGSGAVADKTRCVNEVPHHEVLIGAAKIIVHVLERVHNDCFLHATYVKGNNDGDGKDDEEQTSCLARRKSSRWDWTPCFVYRVFDDRVWQTLVRQVKDEHVDPGPKDHQWRPLEDTDSVW